MKDDPATESNDEGNDVNSDYYLLKSSRNVEAIWNPPFPSRP